MDIYPDYWKDAGMDRDHYLDASYMIGDHTLILGIYEDKEKKKASFFHEIGHLITEKAGSKYDWEKRAWLVGLKLARSMGIEFSSNCYKWIKDQLRTYEKYKEVFIEKSNN